MNKKIIDMLNSTAGRLVFVLLAGAGYFSVVAKLLLDFAAKNALLLLFFCPVIICGAALVLIKLLKQKQEENNTGDVLKLFYLHIAVIIIGLIFAVSIFI